MCRSRFARYHTFPCICHGVQLNSFACTFILDWQPLRHLLAVNGPAIICIIILLLVTRCPDILSASTQYDAVEMFAGDAAVTRALTGVGFRVLSLDIRYMSHTQHARAMDLCTPAGFAVALWAVMKLRPNALAVFAPVCSSFVWINRSTSGRSVSLPLGNTELQHVQVGNLLAARTALLAWLVSWRHGWWIIEQPSSSVMIDHPRMQQLVSHHTVYKHVVCMAWYGGTSMKRTHLYSNAMFLAEMDRKSDTVPRNPHVVRSIKCSGADVQCRLQHTSHGCA